METVSTVIVIGLVSLCGVSVVHADTSLTAFNGRLNLLEGEINAWKHTAVNLETKMNHKVSTLGSSLKENLTSTFIPALMEGLVKQAITDILKKGYIEDMISGRVLDEVNSLKASIHNTKTQLQAVTQQFRHVERERDTFKESNVKLRDELTHDIHSLQLQLNETEAGLHDAKIVNTVLRQDLMTLNTSCVKMSQALERLNNDNQSCRVGLRRMQQKFSTDIQSLNNQLNQTIDDLHDSKQRITVLTEDMMALNTSCVMREEIEENDVNETSLSTSSLTQVPSTTSPPMFPGAAGASNNSSQGERAAQMTTVTTHASSDPSQTARTAVTTSKKPATQATPSPADCGDLRDASYAGNLEKVKRILSQGVDVNCRRWGWTPVMRAAWRGHRDVVELLVGEGADVSLVDGGGNNALHFACYRGHLETVKFVLSLHVVDIDARNNYGRTAADLARRGGHTRVLDLLVSRGAQ
ncbi:ankyrin repeat domain-containing protein 27-like [Haliotis rufescens]|uniref:ankyrin repeat domain-containing protein 27-like n=1 Tax=Haliotis rufescens TaxID=6454 RepID=UPI00201EE420|nr:ankyrin repeat domain-containing protein 27-like [Haliotis rufescens]